MNPLLPPRGMLFRAATGNAVRAFTGVPAWFAGLFVAIAGSAYVRSHSNFSPYQGLSDRYGQYREPHVQNNVNESDQHLASVEEASAFIRKGRHCSERTAKSHAQKQGVLLTQTEFLNCRHAQS